LLNLINEILDLSKIEAGKMEIDVTDVSLTELRDYVERSFRHVADQKNLAYEVKLSDDAPNLIHTDPLRLQQILRNLLSNAFKFTQNGSVILEMSAGDRDLMLEGGHLAKAQD